MRNSRNLTLLLALGLLAGCASVDAQDRFLLGDANRANIAAQSDRDVDLPNSKKVESTSGVRAVNAIGTGPASASRIAAITELAKWSDGIAAQGLPLAVS